MLKTLALRGALALGLLAGFGPALAQTSQPPVTVTSSAYADLGAGPLTIENRSTNPIQVIAADGQPTPSSTTLGHLVGGSAPPSRDFNETKHLWAIAIQSGSVPVITTPISAAALSGSVNTVQTNPSTVAAGQIKIATTNTAVCLPANAMTNGAVIKARDTNVGNGFVGASGVTTTDDGTGNGYRIKPGEAASAAPSNSSAVCVNGTAGDIYYFLGN